VVQFGKLLRIANLLPRQQLHASPPAACIESGFRFILVRILQAVALLSFLIPTFVPVFASQLGAQKITWQQQTFCAAPNSGRKGKLLFPKMSVLEI
jgi:hypothetical protein